MLSILRLYARKTVLWAENEMQLNERQRGKEPNFLSSRMLLSSTETANSYSRKKIIDSLTSQPRRK